MILRSPITEKREPLQQDNSIWWGILPVSPRINYQSVLVAKEFDFLHAEP
jgi:hypothetical protein